MSRTPEIVNKPPAFGGAPAWALGSVQEHFRRQVLEKIKSGTYRLETLARCVCGATGSVTIATQDRFGMPVGVIACTECGLVRTSPRVHADDLPAFYRDDYHGLHFGVPSPDPSQALVRTGQGSRIYALVRSRLRSHVRLGEIGCGTGQVMREFQTAAREDGIKVTATGCEYAESYVEAGRSAGSTILAGPPAVLADQGPYDLVIMSHVLEHFADPVRELELVRQLVTDDGSVFVEVPGILAIHRKPEYDYDLVKYLTLAHTFHFSLDTVSNLVTNAGFALVSGDEHVHAVFQPAERTQPSARGDVRQLKEYLDWLDRSRTLRFKRLVRSVRQHALGTFRRTVGTRNYEAAKRVRRSARLIR